MIWNIMEIVVELARIAIMFAIIVFIANLINDTRYPNAVWIIFVVPFLAVALWF